MQNGKVITAHLSAFLSCFFWGLMTPVAKDALNNGITSMPMVAFRMIGTGALFWIASLFTKSMKVSAHDKWMLALAAVCGLVGDQCLFIVGLSLTSPVNSSIITTTLPIMPLLLAAIILHEPVTVKKVIGILCGATGALILIIGSISAVNSKEGNILGDVLCVVAQFSFAIFLCVFKRMMQKYDVITFQKWMFLFASIMIIPLSLRSLIDLPWADIPMKSWGETAFVVVGGTFVAYILNMVGQRVLLPTVVSMYNYVQPIVACIVSVAAGLAIFGWEQSVAILFVFVGVYLVTKSKSNHVSVKCEKNCETNELN